MRHCAKSCAALPTTVASACFSLTHRALKAATNIVPRLRRIEIALAGPAQLGISFLSTMRAKQLGRTGVSIPEIGLGTWNYHGGANPLRKGIAAGANFIDTAESYGTEAVVGEAIRGISERVFIATKVSPQNFHSSDFRKSVEASLRNLGTETIDLLQLHHPNPAIPIEETMGAMSDLVDQGKIKFCGVSNFSVAQLQAAQKALGKYPIVSNQLRYNVIDRTIEKDILPYCEANGITVIAYSPLSKDLSRITDCDPTGVIAEIARATGKTPAQVVINWCICQQNVVAIPKANSAAHILENCGASGWRLSNDQIALMNSRIQSRHRNKFDALARKLMPPSLQKIAVRARNLLPRRLRRLVS
jgi:diketogulonate reductase-like aldo/keto reductase